ncbi:hypothetical protein FF38_00150 [Lucilia cuprina]|uniref:Uncharacterized protein n=1 Tax=Lucilia cuprina TaxID=7375 RepID=A0A0L0BSZ9_LUCCU|nr:hypothetical protein FF38_00150 [Lucilia cuprina]
MQSVRKLRLTPLNYWRQQYAIVLMSHTKAGYPIVLSLLDMGMYVVAVSPHFKQNEVLRHLLSNEHRQRYFTKQVDLHTIMSINMLIMELKLQVQQVKLFLCLIPQINECEKSDIFEKTSAALLQTILEVNDLGVGALCAAAKRHVIQEDYSHVWCIRFHHNEPDLVHDYLEYLMGLACAAPRNLNVNLVRQNENEKCDCME